MGVNKRYSGYVEAIDQAGTTAWILSGEARFLAFRHGNHPRLEVGRQITFEISGFRAVEIEVLEQAA